MAPMLDVVQLPAGYVRRGSRLACAYDFGRPFRLDVTAIVGNEAGALRWVEGIEEVTGNFRAVRAEQVRAVLD